jgi:uncharacterized protein (DUF58 family)
LRLVRDVLSFVPQDKGTNLAGALQYLNRVQKKRAVVFIISDFVDKGYESLLSSTQRHHDTIAIVTEDPLEQEWPDIGKVLIEDSENGSRGVVSGKSQFRGLYAKARSAEREARDYMFAKMKLDRVVLKTNQDYIKPLLIFFQDRSRRFR